VETHEQKNTLSLSLLMASLMVGALPMTPQALNFGSRLSYSQSQISLCHSTSSLPLSTARTSVPFGN